jgi:hypothetical protein
VQVQRDWRSSPEATSAAKYGHSFSIRHWGLGTYGLMAILVCAFGIVQSLDSIIVVVVLFVELLPRKTNLFFFTDKRGHVALQEAILKLGYE